MKYDIRFFIIAALLLLPNQAFANTKIDLNFISQVPPGVWDLTLNCGQTSYLMVDSYINSYQPTSEMIQDIDDWLFDTYGDPTRGYNGSVTNVYKLRNLAIQYGGYVEDDLEISVDGDLETLKSRIDEGQLIIVAVYINMGLIDYINGHFMIVTGYDDEYFYFNDPGKTLGKDNKYRTEDFVDAWSRQNYSHLIFKVNKDEVTQEIVQEENIDTNEEPPQPEPETQPRESTSIFSRIKNFFANIFSRSSQYIVEGEVSNNQEQIQEPANETASEEQEETDAAPTYDAELLATAPITITASEREVLVTIQARNTGNQDWLQSQVSLNVVGGRAANSQYRHSSWLTDLRPTRLDQSRVAPGDIGTFTTLIRVPEESSDVTFRAQLVRQTGSQFLQLGSGFAAVDIQVRAVAPEPDVAGQQVSDDGSDVPSSGITRQIRETINRVTRDVGETIGDAVEQLSETTKRIFFGGGGSSSSSDNSNDTDDTESTEGVELPTISITSPTSSPYIVATSSIKITGVINDVVRSMSVSTTASGTLSFSTTSLTWQWIGNLDSGTTTVDISAASREHATSTALVVYYAPVYTLDTPVISDPTTSSVWYTNTTSTVIRGKVDTRTTQLMQASSSIPIVSSTWEYLVNTTEEGSYSYEFISSDEFGNISTTTEFALVYDTTEPNVVTSSFALTSTTLEYTLVATDTLSGIAGFDIQIRASSAGDVDTCTGSTSTVLFVDMDSTSTCQWGVINTDEDNGIINIPAVLQHQDSIIRWRAIDAAGNSTDWQYQEVLVSWTEVATSGTIVFSQIAWMGTEASAQDEWFEIHNTTGAFINVFGWYITWGDYNTSTGEYENRFDFIPDEPPPNMPPLPEELQHTVPFEPELYLVFERTDQTTINSPGYSMIYTGDLRNTGELMQLWDVDGKLVDQVDMRNGWVAGDNNTKESMVRIDPSVSGSRADNWCSFLSCPAESLAGEMQYVDADGNPIVGSPRLIVMPDTEPPPIREL